jgi:hypothetical protein
MSLKQYYWSMKSDAQLQSSAIIQLEIGTLHVALIISPETQDRPQHPCVVARPSA